ncbi:peptidoglycan -binding protein [Alkalicaulis satelles]|uniref:Peptidoglycan-binding protein n=1 Tax=Alkalicaulis satelles TaxID=2609175 RepID=A0A5M6ZGT6_9PROT|nr:peptidoglycan -binding protein [Alkalicaulis satelles]KAA5803939.1 peptidoglycan -binding protein [Alkalicaulis satelles]
MALPRHIQFGQNDQGDYWPGFVDALATLLLVIVFLLAVFTAGQFALSTALSGRDEQLAELNARLSTLAQELNLARSENEQLALRVRGLESERDALAATNLALEASMAGLREGLAAARAALEEEEALSEEAQATIALLNNQMAALREELARLNEALNAAEAREAELEAEVVNLGRRLNAALASEVARLARYRSDFLEAMMGVLGDRSGVRVSGDRFVFETDILFASGSAELSEDGRAALTPIADAILQLIGELPSDLDWVLRVDGHTDRVPLGPSAPFRSNWELSTARALSVIEYLESRGVPSRRLLAAGFGEHHPIAQGRTAEAYARNRRIELKLDAR